MPNKDCMDDRLCLAIGDLTSLSESQLHWVGTLKWTIRNEVVSEVSIKYSSCSCVLSYSSNGESCSQIIDFCETPCHFGGNRKWFVCTGCGKKVSKLRFFKASFVCGNCVGLGYKSQRINRARRYQGRAAKIKEELGMEMPASLCRFVENIDKPKGMHWSTFKIKQVKANSYIFKALEFW